jgi:hypothetical protein
MFLKQPYKDVEVGEEDEAIAPEVCEMMGIPVGSKWGANAGEVRQAQIDAGMTFGPISAAGDDDALLMGTQI